MENGIGGSGGSLISIFDCKYRNYFSNKTIIRPKILFLTCFFCFSPPLRAVFGLSAGADAI